VDTFAFIIHPIDPKRDIQKKYPLLGRIATDWMVDHIAPLFPPVYLSEIQGIVSQSTGKRIKGWLIACPLTPKHFCRLPEDRVYRKILETGRLAEKLGANILGLGAFTSVVGDSGYTIAKELDIPVTTGDSYTVAVALDALREAAGLLEVSVPGSTAAVVGATGAIGKICAEFLSQEVAELILIGRNLVELEATKEHLLSKTPMSKIWTSISMDDLRKAHLVISVTSAAASVISPDHLRTGSIVLDVARPRDVAARVAEQRPDVLVIDGGVVAVPGPVNFNFNFGLPSGMAFACMAETMALTLEGRFEDYSIGKNLQIYQVREIASIARKHGFHVNGFRSFEKSVPDEQIARVRYHARINHV
jgi:fatty aldehyde-generating acyl-ACP reductase